MAKVGGARTGGMSRRNQIPIDPDVLREVGEILVKQLGIEAKKDFAKRGWSGQAKDGSAPVWDSFSFRTKGDYTIEILSSFPDLAKLTGEDLPEHRMEWLTQEAKDRHPARYPLTETEKKLGMKRTGKVSKGDRMPLVVPLKAEGGQVIFRLAPLTFADAWVHPGIARFGFIPRAIRKGKKLFAQRMVEEAKKHLAERIKKETRTPR